jgi:hypothetical protein
LVLKRSPELDIHGGRRWNLNNVRGDSKFTYELRLLFELSSECFDFFSNTHQFSAQGIHSLRKMLPATV